MKGMLLVDFSHLARRSFHLVEESRGLVNGTTFTVLRMLKRIKTSYPDHLIVCVFDGKKATALIRKHVFSSYKEHRFVPKGASSVLLSQSFYPQVDYLYQILGCLGIWVMKSEIFEADVIIASQVCEKSVEKISFFDQSYDDIVMSGDQDYIPMIRDGVSWLRPTSKGGVANLLIKYSTATVCKEFGVSPNMFPFVKLLLGDKSDGVEGVKGYGKVKSFKAILELRRRFRPQKKHEFLKVISREMGIPMSILFPKFILFDMGHPGLLVNYVTSRIPYNVLASDFLSVRSPESSLKIFRNICRQFKFETILGELDDWAYVFGL